MSFRPRRSGGADVLQGIPLTIALIAANIAIYVVQASNSDVLVVMDSGTAAGSPVIEGSVDGHFGLWGPIVASGEWWRLVTSGFLHASVLHLGMNMLSLFFLGRVLEPALGWLRLAAIYFVSLAAGSLGVILLDPDALTMGASGAIFGLAGGLLVVFRSSGIGIMESGIGPVVLLNLAITFTIPGISIGGHLGGLAGGAAITWVIVALARRRRLRGGGAAEVAGVAVVAFVALLVVAYGLARSKYPSLG